MNIGLAFYVPFFYHRYHILSLVINKSAKKYRKVYYIRISKKYMYCLFDRSYMIPGVYR